MENGNRLFTVWLGLLLAVTVLTGCEKDTTGPPSGPAKNLSVDLAGGVQMEFVLIPAGSFMMGADNGEANEKPVHKVIISQPFYLGKYEVTQEQWQTVMASNPSTLKGPKNPVNYVSWDDCQNFLSKLNEKVKGLKFALPTEAQWEYACRAGSTAAYSFGDAESDLSEYAWYMANSGKTTHPVGGKKPNAWGLYDMHGNVGEWCSGWYGPYASGEQKDPAGASSGQDRVLHGGSWSGYPTNCRAAFRNKRPTDRRHHHYGLRVLGVVGGSAGTP